MNKSKDEEKHHPVEDIVESIAEIEDDDPVEVNPVLYEILDPESLEDLIASANDSLRVEFEYQGYHVIASGDGEVSVESPSDR